MDAAPNHHGDLPMKAFLLAAALALTSATVPAATISGPASVRDGDTITVAGTEVRLKGVDAAELGTFRGEAAVQFVRLTIEGHTVTCELTGEETHDREGGYCWEGNRHLIRELGTRIVASGFALACPRYSTRYLPFETAEAKANQARASDCVIPLVPARLGAVTEIVAPTTSAVPEHGSAINRWRQAR